MRHHAELYGNFTFDIIILQGTLYDKRIGGGVYYSSIPFINDNKYSVEIHTVISPITYYNNSLTRYIVQEQFSTKANIFKLIYEGEYRIIMAIDKAPRINIDAGVGKPDVTIVNPVLGEISISLLKRIRAYTKILAIDIQGFMRSINNRNIIIAERTVESIEAIKLSDIVHMSFEEAVQLTLSSDINQISRRLAKINKKAVFIITRDEDPPILVINNRFSVIGTRQKPVRDRTGAGDYFLSTFTKKYIEINDEIESVQHAIKKTTRWLVSRNASLQPTAPKPPPPNL